MSTEHREERKGALPTALRLIRSHPDDNTRRNLLELVAHDHNEFGDEEAMFYYAPDGSHRAAIAQACVDRYNSHSAQQAKVEGLVRANEILIGALQEIKRTQPVTVMNGDARMSDPDHIKAGWNFAFIARQAIEDASAALQLAQTEGKP